MKKIILVLLFIGLLFPLPSFASWSQDAGNAQRTGYTPEEPVEPWTYTWSFNGSDASGGTGGHTYNGANEARTVAGGGNIYIPSGIQGIYAISLTSGTQVWKFNPTGVRFIAAPAYDSGFVYVGGSTGNVYKINATTGALSGTYAAGSASNKAVLVVGTYIYVVTDDGKLHKIDSSTMNSVWIYTAGATGATPPSYSQSRNCIIYGTDDLYIHAVNNTDGSRKWRVKPSPNLPYNDPAAISQTTNGGTPTGNQLERGYPVIADATGIVFIRMQLPHDYLFAGPNNGLFGSTNDESRTWLMQNPQYKSLFALNLDDGSEKFIPAVGYGSTEDYITGRSEGYGVMGEQPVVKQLASGKEVAYIQFRNSQSAAPDFRWSGHMGEMVLDSSTITGLNAGDLRFVKMNNYNGYGGNSYTQIIDEESPLTMAGTSLLFAHWSASTSVQITNRADTLGLTYTNPIQTSLHPPIMRAIQSISCKDTTTHYTGSCTSLNYVTDGGRFYGGPGFWSYFGVADPPGWKTDLTLQDSGGSTGAGTSYSAGFTPRYTYVSDGYMIVEGNGGDIMAFKHSGTVVNATPTVTGTTNPTLTPTPTIVLGTGDTNGDGKVDFTDLKAILSSWLQLVTNTLDQYGDGRINTLDFVRVIKQMPAPTPTGGTQSGTVTLQITASADDVNESDTQFSATDTTLSFGGCGSPTICNAGMRFLNVQVPKGATITDAHLDVTSPTTAWNAVGYDIFAELSPNSTAFSTSSKPSQRSLSSNKVTVSDDVQWLANTTYSLPNMASAIQEVINQSSWTPGNALSLIVKATTPSGFGRKFVSSFDGSTTAAPKLIITYSGSGGTGVTPTNTPAQATNTPSPTSGSGPTSTPTPTPTPQSNRTPVAFAVGTGYTDVTPRQLVRTSSDKLYVFGGMASGSNVIAAYWTNSTGLPSGTTSFNGSAQVSDANVIIQTDAVYDGGNTIHVLVNTQGGNVKDYPFDLTTNTFKSAKTIATGNPTVSGDYLGSGGVSGMYDKTGTLHIAYWSNGNHITYRSYTYAPTTDSLTLTAGPTQIDTAGSSNHPHLVVSPFDNSVTIAWVSEATTPAQILAKVKPAGGSFGSIQVVSSSAVWTSTSAGINIDQGPNMVIDSSGKKYLVYIENWDSTNDYGHVHYVTTTGATWSDQAIPNYYTHDPAIALTSAGEIMTFGHGHPNNDACKNSLDMCFKKLNTNGTWGTTQLFKASDATGGYDASPSIKWSVVGFTRPETVELLWFRTNGGSYYNTTIMYGRY